MACAYGGIGPRGRLQPGFGFGVENACGVVVVVVVVFHFNTYVRPRLPIQSGSFPPGVSVLTVLSFAAARSPCDCRRYNTALVEFTGSEGEEDFGGVIVLTDVSVRFRRAFFFLLISDGYRHGRSAVYGGPRLTDSRREWCNLVQYGCN